MLFVLLSAPLWWQDGGKQLQEGMEENVTITHMDLRLTECGQESEYCINEVLHRNQEAARDAQLKATHAQPQKKIAQPQAAHRYKLPIPQAWAMRILFAFIYKLRYYLFSFTNEWHKMYVFMKLLIAFINKLMM